MRVRDSVNLVQPVDVETATEDPMVDWVEVACSEGAAKDIKQTQGYFVMQAQGSYVKDLVEELVREGGG